MRHTTLRTLTWGTVAAAVSSALWLAASEPDWPDSRKIVKAAGPAMRALSEPAAAVTSRSGTEQSTGTAQPADPMSR